MQREFATKALRLVDGTLYLLDQSLLPHREEWITITSLDKMLDAIKLLRVRGAPLIGIAAGLYFGLHLGRHKVSWADAELVYRKLRASRPTAVNLMNELDLLWQEYQKSQDAEAVMTLACQRAELDIAMCAAMAKNMFTLLSSGDRLLTHCNTGGLATVGVGTALGGIIHAHNAGLAIHTYVDETRPLLQGSRLTSWELDQVAASYTLICDSMAASLMQGRKIDKVFVGADRITKNHDVANKIGTYGLAVLARYHSIPFYVVAPSSTFDKELRSGSDVTIEQRSGDEVRSIASGKGALALSKAKAVYNPAFDVTPRELITGIVTEQGMISC